MVPGPGIILILTGLTRDTEWLNTWTRSQTLSGELAGAMGKGSHIGSLSLLRSSSLASSLFSPSPEPERWKSSSWGWHAPKHSFLEWKLFGLPCGKSYIGHNGPAASSIASYYLTTREDERNTFLQLRNIVVPGETLRAWSPLSWKTTLAVVCHVQSSCDRHRIAHLRHGLITHTEGRSWYCWRSPVILSGVTTVRLKCYFITKFSTVLFCLKVVIISLKDFV